ncbi:hypothetical protein, partial [Sphingobium yanoikuyae]|uniref:hypothetical protein n=1 Tax=Sphingobium yanoikuyae TaxID=13690 RepID=UPI001BAFD0F9
MCSDVRSPSGGKSCRSAVDQRGPRSDFPPVPKSRPSALRKSTPRTAKASDKRQLPIADFRLRQQLYGMKYIFLAKSLCSIGSQQPYHRQESKYIIIHGGWASYPGTGAFTKLSK